MTDREKQEILTEDSFAENRSEKLFLEVFADAAVLLGITISKSQLEAICRYYGLLKTWGAKINLTAALKPDKAARELFSDSAVVEPELLPDASVLDIGSGAGFPGLVAAILRPDLEITLLEARAKKVEFLKHVCRVLALGRVEARHGRWPEDALSRRYDVVLSRATFSDCSAWNGLGEVLKPDGQLILWQTEKTAFSLSGFTRRERPYSLPTWNMIRHLAIFKSED